MSKLSISGLYRPEFEKDSCGFGLIAQMDGKASHWLVKTAIQSLGRLTHRGAISADGKTGDGCGLLMKMPRDYMRAKADAANIKLDEHFAVGLVFLSKDKKTTQQWRELLTDSSPNKAMYNPTHAPYVCGWHHSHR